jgi:hypothetical protein
MFYSPPPHVSLPVPLPFSFCTVNIFVVNPVYDTCCTLSGSSSTMNTRYRSRGPYKAALRVEEDYLGYIYNSENKKLFTVITYFILRPV